MNDIRKEILISLCDLLTPQQLQSFSITLDAILYDYNIEAKSRELVTTSYTNQVILKNFLNDKKLRGCSPNTIEVYGTMLSKFLNEINMPVADIDADDIRCYLAQYKVNKNVTLTTINNMRSYYNAFFRWCQLEGIISSNPVDKLSKFKQVKRAIHPYSDEELEIIFSHCTSLRDRALCEFLYSTGMRVSECANVELTDIDFGHNRVLVRSGKGGKERMTYISHKCMVHLKEYIMSRGDVMPYLFLSKRGRLTASGIEQALSRIGAECNIRVKPHRFRHTMATNMVRRGAPLHIVQKILGHADISTTMIYVDIQEEDVRNAHKQLVA